MSSPVTGRRAHGPLAYSWERSAGTSNANYVPIGATTAIHHDTMAPADGSVRYYRCRLSADGADPAYSVPDAGHRAATTTACTTDTTFTGEPGVAGVTVTTANLTHDANLQAVWDLFPAVETLSPIGVWPPVEVRGATVIATGAQDRQFYVQDRNRAMQVYLPNGVVAGVRPGQRVDFDVHEIGFFSGNPQIMTISDFTIVSHNNPVPYRNMTGQPLDVDDHLYRLVRVGGRLSTTAIPCGGASYCYDLVHGPAHDLLSTVFRTSSDTLHGGECVTFFGPMVAFPGSHTANGVPLPQLDTINDRWYRVRPD